MATKDELATRLLQRFKGVPNYTIDDALNSVSEAMLALGYGADGVVPEDKASTLLLLAQSESAYQVAFSVAHYFKYTDGEESVDKSSVASNYRALAKDLRDRCEKEATGAGVSMASFRIATRADRDVGTGYYAFKRDSPSNLLARPWSR